MGVRAIGAGVLTCAVAIGAVIGLGGLAWSAPAPQTIARAEAVLSAFTPDKPGLAVIVAQNGEVVYERYVGASDLEHGVPVTAATRFHVASVSKEFTAFAALQLAHAGKLDLGADIRAYLPYMPAYDAPITPLDLIHHTSGLRDQWELVILSGGSIENLITQNQLISAVSRQRELNFAPGTDIRYSNSGYSLLAEIVAKVSGETFPDYARTHIFQPLGMMDTLVYGDASMVLKDRAMSYVVGKDGVVRLARLNYANYGATSVHTTARDLLKWSRELLHPKVFDAAIIHEAQTPGRLRNGVPINYAFGMIDTEIGGRRAITHSGADAGYRALVASFPAEDASIVILSNGVADVGVIASELTHIFLGAEAPVLPQTPDPKLLASLAGYYVGDWGPGFDLKLDEGKLTEGAGDRLLQATFLPDGRFTFSGPAAAFTRRSDGALEQVQAVGGLTSVFRPSPRSAPSAEALAQIAGAYRNEALDVTYTAEVKDGGLVLKSLRADPITFLTADADHFDGAFMRLAVVRGGAGQVTALRLSTGRIKGVDFTRR